MPTICVECKHYLGHFLHEQNDVDLCAAYPLKARYDLVYGFRVNRDFGEARAHNDGNCKEFSKRI